MINPENYLSKIATIDIRTMPMPLQKGHEFLMKATSNGTDWSTYNNSTAIRKTIQLYFERLAEVIPASAKTGKAKHPKEAKTETTSVSPRPEKKSKKSKAEIPNAIMVERMPEELRFIKRYVNLNGKTKTKEEILRFVNSLQKAIVEKRIRKTSPYADQVKYIQEKLIDVYNTMKAKIRLELQPETIE
jgi:hypothetical protein